MATFHFCRNTGRIFVLTLLTALAGCRESKPSSSEQFFQYLRFEDFSGLDSVRWNHDLRVSWAIPDNWEALPMKKTALFAHQQWRSPTASTGVGVAHVALPLPIPAQAFLWFAKNEYMRRARDQKDGRLIGEWTDELGRQWFEAENNRYHVCGYAIARGSEAWIVYSGWRRTREPVPQEIALARRSVESVIPTN